MSSFASHPGPQPHSRRLFLQYAGAATLVAGLPGCATPKAEPATGELRVRLEAHDPAQLRRELDILRTRLLQRGAPRVIESNRRPHLILALDPRLGRESFRIAESRGALRIASGSPLGLLYGIGRFLRTCRYGDSFQLSTWRGESTPRGTIRGIYFATHFHNWYHQASAAELSRYLEDLALWGVNAVMAIFPMINLRDWDDPQAAPAMATLRQVARAARELGLQITTGINNTLFTGAPQEIRATRLPDPTHRRGNSGHPICPSQPAGHAYIVDNTRRLFENLADVGLDIVMHWPYDEGGCACAACSPWGSRGYLKLSRDLTQLARGYFPRVKTVLSTWLFDTPPEGEWAGLTQSLAAGNDWVDYILADAHEDFPRYPLDVGVPGKLPLLNFPEISMWGNWPWGGVGAHPLPVRFQRLWDQVKGAVSGGFPYSEGIYEDINKAIVLQYYWDRDRPARTTVEEYVAYEFGAGAIDDGVRLIYGLEEAATRAAMKEPIDKSTVESNAARAEALAQRLPGWVRANWRWEQVYLRAILDRERFAGAGLQTPAAEAALLRLIELYHCELETDDPYHHRVRPALRRAVSRKGNL